MTTTGSPAAMRPNMAQEGEAISARLPVAAIVLLALAVPAF